MIEYIHQSTPFGSNGYTKFCPKERLTELPCKQMDLLWGKITNL